MLNAKYTDQDVRTHPDLIEIAHVFLRQYQGDWDFLVQCKNYLEQHNFLPVTTVRGVLNAMRGNPQGAMSLPQTETGRPVDGTRAPEGGPFSPSIHRSACEVQDALHSVCTQIAKVCHVIREEHCQLRWYTQLQVFVPKITPWCGKYVYNVMEGAYFMSYSEHGRRICAGCKRNLEAYSGDSFY